MRYHKFNESLSRGKAGEQYLLEVWPGLEKLDGKESDFKIISTGELLELKTDSYSMQKTQNFFIETFSDSGKGKLGGPWQALGHGSKYWVYMYIQDKTAFVFDTEKLVDWLNESSKVYPMREIPNRSWTTSGMLVPRSDLAHLYEIREFK